MQMSDGNDEKALRLDAIDESVREARDKGAAEARSEWTAAFREGSQSLVCALHGYDEITAQILRLDFVLPRRRQELRVNFGMKRYGCHRSEDRAFSSTRSAGTESTLPDSRSSSRRSASRIQSSSDPGSDA